MTTIFDFFYEDKVQGIKEFSSIDKFIEYKEPEPPSIKMQNLDWLCEFETYKNINILVPWWIISAWSYEKSYPVITDACFDNVVYRLNKNWDNVEHRHKELLDRGILKSSLAINNKYPNIAIHSCIGLMKKWNLYDDKTIKGII